jgi:very-short-patch-repair endonuclease
MANRPAKSDQQNSPPSKGGVPEVRGGCASEHKLSNLSKLRPQRRELRNNLTPAEAKFWKAVQNKNLDGRKFRRQHSVGKYILDFYCPQEKLAVELDGEPHFTDAGRDRDRERRFYLESCGIKVLRFENRLVFEDLEWVLGVIKNNFGWRENNHEKTDPT